ncbi:MAG: phosphatase PAP2 family protein [Candidatus Micrarchaeota archaeon]|nr:phosphatase PAP2 family protein [Candidatus Micrarchaeota archaeon]
MDSGQLFLDAFGLVRTPVREASIFLNDPVAGALFFAALVLVLSYVFKEQKKLPFILTAIVVALLLGLAFKSFLQEPRPCTAVPGKVICPLDFALPSIHTLLVFTLVILAVGNRSFAIYLILALFTAFSRVYLGVHTISEVAAGLAMAFFACVLNEIIWKMAKWKIPSEIHLRHDAARLRK